MPQQDPRARITNFDEVPLGYTGEQARLEAERCLQCKKPLCQQGCPVGVKIPDFIRLIKDDDLPGAVRKLKEDNLLPAICGRVCPQEDQCEKMCVLGRKGEPIAIGRLERFVADWEREHNMPAAQFQKDTQHAGKVAVVGSGPAGLTCAG
ncbi:MAG: hypothetical protein ACTSWM_09075, partial [Alphaproteobacteria bacterium]